MTADTNGDLGSILGIWAHPDDEAYASAGLMAHAVAIGRRVVCVTATKGERGFAAEDQRSTAERSAVRERELAECLRILGVTEHRSLGYADGGCANVPDDEAAGRLVEIIEAVQPDTVLTFGPDGGTGHPDHIAACRWTTLAVERATATPRLLYATKTAAWLDDRFSAGFDRSSVMMVEDLEPEAFDAADLAVDFTCSDDLAARKVSALRAQASQVEPMVAHLGLAAYTDFIREEFFREPRPIDVELIERAKHLKSR